MNKTKVFKLGYGLFTPPEPKRGEEDNRKYFNTNRNIKDNHLKNLELKMYTQDYIYEKMLLKIIRRFFT